MAAEPEYGTILVAVDFSRPSRAAFRHALSLARRLGARLEVVHVVPHLKPSLPFHTMNRQVVEELQDESRAEAEASLAKLAERPPRGLRIHTAVLLGKPVEQILAHARRRRAALVVLGQRGQGLAESLLIGSTAERVTRRSPVPVLLVPAPDRSRRQEADPGG